MARHVSESWRTYFGPGAAATATLALATAGLGLGLPLVHRLRQVLAAARRDEREPADAILVLGRALRDEQPTPVFVARLEHGRALFEQGLAPRLIITGGLTGDSRRSEAAAGREYLLARGVAPEAVLTEDHSRHTLENLFNVRETLRANGWRRLIAVSDPLHLGRVAAYARGFGLDLQLSPARQAPPLAGSPGWWLRATKEAFFVHWYHVGFAYSRAIRARRWLDRVT